MAELSKDLQQIIKVNLMIIAKAVKDYKESGTFISPEFSDGTYFDLSMSICEAASKGISFVNIHYEQAQAIDELLSSLFRKWPKYSGHESYPVPSATKGKTAKQNYWMRGSKWDGEYGELRFELLEFMINNFPE